MPDKTPRDYLHKSESPWITLSTSTSIEDKSFMHIFYNNDDRDLRVTKLRCWKMKDEKSLMDEFGSAFQFYDWFGENWDALEELLGCLEEWITAAGHILVFTRAHEILIDASEKQLAILLSVLHNSGEWWSKPIENNEYGCDNRPALPFQSLFLTASEYYPNVKKRFQKASIINKEAHIRYDESFM